ncbi:caskin-1-like [Zophobas morio]|uniref:caskin-1-like n=1 Tax=Zophobas morio TaxID=2755281 RepID=UPI003083B388
MVGCRDLDEVMLLVANGAKVNIPDKNDTMPMNYACTKVDSSDYYGRLPIHYACEQGDLDEVMLLVANGTAVDIPDGDGRLPMHYACKNRFDGPSIMPFFIKEGANVDYPYHDGLLPIHYTCEYAHLKTVELLVANRMVRKWMFRKEMVCYPKILRQMFLQNPNLCVNKLVYIGDSGLNLNHTRSYEMEYLKVSK